MEFSFSAKIWKYPGHAAWHFVTLPKDISEDIRAFQLHERGFGSIRVVAAIGTTTWTTSIFPDSLSGCYLLPLKKDIRISESLAENDVVVCSLVVSQG